MPGTGKTKDKDRFQGGDSLIEVIVAMLIVGMIILGLVPMYSYIRTHQIINISRNAAYAIAKSQIDAIQAAPFVSTYDVARGWQGMGTMVSASVIGNPPGPFLQQSLVKDPHTPGIVYHMSTQIKWKTDYSKSEDDPIRVDYKDIAVEVKAQIPYIKPALCPDVILNRKVTAENQWGELPGGNIYVTAYQDSGKTLAISNITVDLTGPAATYEMLTDSASGDMPGEVLFAQLDAGTYTMTAVDKNNVMMVMPGIKTDYGGDGQSYTITTNEVVHHQFYAEKPCSIQLNFQDSDGNQVNISSFKIALASYSYPQLDKSLSFTSTSPPYIIDNIWPLGADGWSGNYSISFTSIVGSDGTNYSSSGTDWDGTFTSAGQHNLPVKITLTK